MPPWLLLLLLGSLTLALVYQLAARRFGWRVLIYWALVFAAVTAAEVAAEGAGVNVTRFGELRLLPDLATGIAATVVMWLLRV